MPAVFEAPHRLPPPSSASLDPSSRILTMPEPPPGTELRFTLDGSEPCLASPCYTAPLRLPLVDEANLPADCALQLRVKAFPAPSAPSEELSLRLELSQVYE